MLEPQCSFESSTLALFIYFIQVAVVGFVSGDKLDAFNAAGDSFDDVPFGVLDADAAAALEVAEGQVALLKQVSTIDISVVQSQTAQTSIVFVTFGKRIEMYI